MRLVLGVIGHVDHGKTALVHALTGTDTDRLAEEKRRGISIALGFAHLTLPGGTIDFVDMPGHERFVRTMVSGATGMDAALLVVAANEGIKPQTREHLDIAALLSIGTVMIAVTKIDLSETPDAVAQAAAAHVRQLGMQVAAVVLTSAATGAGLPDLRDALAAMLQDTARVADDGFFYLPIDRAFTMQGHGTVVTGTLRHGTLSVTDEAVLLPGNRKVRLRGLQVHGARTATVQPGQRAAANLRDIDASDLPRGTALAPSGLLASSTWLSVTLTAVESAPPLPSGARLTLLAGTLETWVRLRLLDRDELRPGETALAQLHTECPVALPARERFILRRPLPALTVGGGRIIDPGAQRVRRQAPGAPPPADHTWLRALAAATPGEIVRREIAQAGPAGVATLRVARLAGVSEARAIAEAGASTLLAGRTAVLRESFATVLQTMCALLSEAPDGLSRAHLARGLAGTSPAVLEAALATLMRQGTLRSGDGVIRLKNTERETSRAAQEQAAAQKLAEVLRDGGLSPPDPASLMPPPLARRLTEFLVRDGRAIRTFDVVQKREIIFHHDAIETAKRMLAGHLAAEPGLRVGEAGAVLGISRKYAVPLLEHLDAIHFTRRTGDRRRLAEPGASPAESKSLLF